MAGTGRWIGREYAGSPIGEVARVALTARLRAVMDRLRGAAYQADEDIEHVHKLRVTTRRANAALELFAEFLPPKRRKRLVKKLKALRKSAGAARDLDVLIARFAKSSDAATQDVCDRLRRRRREAQHEIVACVEPLLHEDCLQRKCEHLVELVGGGESVQQQYVVWAQGQLNEEWHRIRDDAPDDDAPIEELHRFRVDGKHFRYSLELIAGALPPIVREELYPEVEEMQEQLGAVNDHHVAAHRFARWAQQAASDSEQQLMEKLAQEEQRLLTAGVHKFREWWSQGRLSGWGAIVKQATSA